MKEWTIKLPTLDLKHKTVAGTVIILLTKEWPLSTKGLFERIRTGYSKDISFQGVHKAVKKLHSENILTKEGGYYKLDKKWLQDIGMFSAKVRKNYGRNETRLKGLP